MPILNWRPLALTDLLAIVDHIANDNPKAAQDLKDEIAAKAARLVDMPKAYRGGRVEGTRELVIRRNYLIVYREDDRAVTILRVLHAAQQWPKPMSPEKDDGG